MSEELVADIRLVVEEAVSNTIRHGYLDQDPHEIRIRVAVEGRRFALEIDDDARPFDPLAAPLPDVTIPVEEKRIGGLGILLIRSLMDHVEYRRSGNRNLLRMERSLDRA